MKYVISLTITTPNIEGDSSRITYVDNLPFDYDLIKFEIRITSLSLIKFI